MSIMQHVNTSALQRYLLTLPIMRQANTIKLIHGWIPTYASLCPQGREPTSICPRCASQVETTEHFHQCTDDKAFSSQQSLL